MTTPVTPAIESAGSLRTKTRIAALNATVLYTLAYLLVDSLYRLVTVVVARSFHIPGTWSLDRVHFHIPDGAWWQTAVVSVYGAGPLACLLLTVAAVLWFRKLRPKRGLRKQFAFWLVAHGLNLFFGAMVADNFTQSGFWYVPSWLFMAGNIPNVAVGAVFGLLLLVLGYAAAPLYLQSHDSRSLMRFEERRRLLLATLFAPWLVGSLLVVLLKLPIITTNELLHLAAMLLFIVPLAGASTNDLFEFTISMPSKTRAAWGLVGLLGALLLGLRVVLGHGISFG